jgi:hypothetical protein
MGMGPTRLPAACWQRAGRRCVAVTLVLLTTLPLAGCAHSQSLRASVLPPTALAPGFAPTAALSTVTPTLAQVPAAIPASATPVPPPVPPSTATQVARQEESPTTLPLPIPGSLPIRSKIEIVWPHDNAPVREATLANITAYLIVGPGNEPPPCEWDPVVHLWAGQNGAPARVVAAGQKRMINQGGSTFPAWDFNDVDVSAAQDPTGKLAFFATVDDTSTYHNIWIHAADPRTIFPQADMPRGVTDRQPKAVDARIEIVWPHDSAPAQEAKLANVTVYLFEVGSMVALSPSVSWTPVVRLHRSLNVDPEKPGTAVIGQPRTVTVNGLTFEAWDFNDVDVSAAQDPLNRLYFWVSVDDVVTFSNVWAHGADARTFFPEPETLSSCR